MSAQPRDERGFALVEMLIAIVVINVALLAILLSLTSGVASLRRSAEVSTASAVADKQLERTAPSPSRRSISTRRRWPRPIRPTRETARTRPLR